MRRIIAITSFVFMFAVGLAFAAINIEPVEINYYSGSITMPLAVGLIFSLSAGVMIGVIIMYIGGLRLRYINKHLNKKLASYEQQINSFQTSLHKNDHQ